MTRADAWGAPPLPRPGMRLLKWKPLVRNSLRGFADIELPSGLRISEIPVLVSHGKCWASLPSEPVLDRDGRHLVEGGKKQYVTLLQWRSREIADAFSSKVIALVRAQHPNALEGEGEP